MMQALSGQPITVYGEGTQTRSFCYVDDMVDAFIRLMNTPDELTGPVNLGNPHELTMLEVARRIIALTGSSSEIVFKPLPMDDPWHRQPDIALAREALGWSPTTPLDEGLQRTAQHFRQIIEASESRAAQHI
jgi:UDP-glucuronate decarboxylase